MTDEHRAGPTDAPAPGVGGRAGWFPDPLGRYDHRWYNGSTWTGDVSVDGRRTVDPVPAHATWAPLGAPGRPWPGQRPPSRTMAVLSMILGIASVATGWMPFVFVLAAAAAIAAIVLGVIVRRRAAEGRATGVGMATAGLVLGPIGLAMCVLGGWFTVALWQAVTEFVEPGPHDAEIVGCVAEDLGVRVSGSITNRSGTERDYSILIDVLDGRRVVETETITVDDVPAGDTVEFDQFVLTRGDTPDRPSCEIDAVNGPLPFGIDPNA